MTDTFKGRKVLTPTAPAMPSVEDLLKLIKAQQEQIEALAKSKARAVAFKVSEKGCVTITGIGTYGMTVYASQWAQVLDHAPALAAFITTNADRLSFKDPAAKATALASCKTYLD